MKDFAQHGWKEVSLGEICEKTETVDPRKAPEDEFDYVDVSSVSNETFTIGETQKLLGADAPSRARRQIRSGDILFATIRPTLQRIAQVPEHLDGQVCSTGYIVLRPKPTLDARFLMHALFRPEFMGAMETLQSGASYPAVTDKQVRAQRIPLPPLEEQQRIVAVLDEVFEGLTRARDHAEANLQNARELFDSALDEALHPGSPDWRTLTVADTLTRTKVPAKIQRKAYLEEGAFPIVSQEAGLINGYWNDEDDVIHLKRPVVVFGDHTRALKYVDFDFVVGADGTQIMAPVECLEPRFYYYALKTIDLEGKGYARHFSHLKKCEINYPDSIEAQKSTAARLDDLSANTQELAKQYIRTLQDLDDLRQSLLQKAFAGELT